MYKYSIEPTFSNNIQNSLEMCLHYKTYYCGETQTFSFRAIQLSFQDTKCAMCKNYNLKKKEFFFPQMSWLGF